MKKPRLFYLLLTFFSISILATTNEPSRTAIDAIQSNDIRRHIDFLASDSLLGRDTPSDGLNIAAQYIANEFQSYGLKPLSGNFFQTFEVSRVRLGQENALQLKTPDKEEISFQIKKEFMPYGFTASKDVSGELVFAGYGITAPEFNYDDYKGLDVDGKIVLVLRHEPREDETGEEFDGTAVTEHSLIRKKVENAADHGAIGFLLVTDPFNHRSLRPRGFPWPSLFENIPNEAIPLTMTLERKKIPAVQVGKEFVKHVFVSVDSLKKIQEQIDLSLQPNSFLLRNFQVQLQTTTLPESAKTQNVVGFLEGSDPQLKKQAVVIGAHYDHVGYNKEEVGSDKDYIYNGADDNASGIAGILAVAKAFGAGSRPKRSIIFIAFAGEEKGLFGSKFYVETPLWPLEHTHAMLNMDMIGRNTGDEITIIGYTKSPRLNDLNIEANRFVGMKLDYSGEQFFRRSDQYNFAKKGVPVLMYHSGTHEDYHKVGDNPDKINNGKIAMISRLVFRTAWLAANRKNL